MAEDIIPFIRRRDYRYIKELGEGGCGKTVLLHDDMIDLHFVCKKFAPSDSGMRDALFDGFTNEVRLMHRLLHKNVVRVFGHYLYPKEPAGFILMEYIEGETIDKYVHQRPDALGSLLRQTLDAFSHLEECGILHRDIRFGNVLVRNDGVVKLIDLGFGKKVDNDEDYKKSITLNWAFTPPREFDVGKYDFSTELYFVGKLFDYVATEVGCNDLGVTETLRKMCSVSPDGRPGSFAEAKLLMNQVELEGEEFTEADISVYRSFADELIFGIEEIEANGQNVGDSDKVIQNLSTLYKASMLESAVPPQRVVGCFFRGGYRYNKNASISVANIREFMRLLKQSDSEGRRIILANLYGRLDAVDRFFEDEIPF